MSITSLNAKYAADGTMNVATNAFKLSYTVANMTFTSTSMKWLVINGTNTWLRGEGVKNIGGVTEPCYYLFSVVDGSPDKVRVKIWSKTTPTVVYYDSQKDANGVSAPDNAA